VASVAKRLGVITHSLYAWIKKFGPDSAEHGAAAAEQAEIKRLNKELKRATEERDIQKKPRRTSSSVEVRYAFIKEQSGHSPVRRLCQWLDVHPSDYYGWRKQPRSARSEANELLTRLIKLFWVESGGVYDCRKIYSNLREHGEGCGKNRVHRLMRAAGPRVEVNYRRTLSAGYN